MFLLSAVTALSVLSSVYAQNNGTVHVIKVGGIQANNENIFMFSPSNVTAAVGDVIQFTFSGVPGNHSVTQSSFASPCTRVNGGFDSGWVFVAPTHDPNAPPATWNLTVTAATPLWFFCKQTVPMFHCSSGMVGAINAPTSGSNTMDNYVNNAKSAGAPDQGIGGLVGQGASASALPGPITGDLGYAGTPVSGMASATSGASTSGGNPTPTNAAASIGYSSLMMMVAAAALGIALA